MLLLAIDTAGPDCAAALARSGARGGEILVRASERIGRGHAERLMPMIEAVLAKGGVGFDDLDRIAVTTGPGSFTGVRVGIAAARGLALALDIPAIGVGTLDALAYPAIRARNDGTVVAALDAKRGEVYLLARDIGSGATLIPASALPIADLAARLAEAPRPLALVGSGAPIIVDALGGSLISLDASSDSPDIGDVALLGLAAAEKTSAPVPLYARGADAKPQAAKVLVRA